MTIVTSLYVHVPFCRHLCNYCDFYKQKFDKPHAQRDEFAAYLRSSLERHESIMCEQSAQWGPLETVYFGGGTPSLWDVAGAAVWKGLFPLASGAEVTFEVDPGAWTPEGLAAWEDAGVNRYSVGTQSLDAEYLRILDRAHDREETFKLLRHLAGKNFSVDFLLGAPQGLKNRDVIKELEELLSYGPKHLSLYILQPAAGYKLKAKIPDDEITSREYLAVSEYLRSRGFHHYEVSNFALPGFEARHNLRYWHGESVAALGPTGTGYIAQGQQKAYRYKWKPGRPEVEVEDLTLKELELEKLYLRLRLSEPFRSSDFSGVLHFEKRLEDWQRRGLVVRVDNAWQMTPEAWVVLDSLLNELFSAAGT